MRIEGIVTVLIGFIAILAMTGCEEGSNPENVRELPPEFEMLLTDEEYLNNEVIIDWNELVI